MLIGGIAEITATIAAQLDDGASTAGGHAGHQRDSAALERQVHTGLLPAAAGVALDDLAKAVQDQRYELAL